ncbi:MAG: hypothetical protein JWQ04_3410, partial [Pedosphaera sp.]|nr:hypothetical protein [Pedosphaera sp.]
MRMIMAVEGVKAADGLILMATATIAGIVTGATESGKQHNSCNKNRIRLDKLMKFSNQLTTMRFASFSTIALLAGASAILPENLPAADAQEAFSKPAFAQRLFATPDEAAKALQLAAATTDKEGLCGIFGPESREMLTGDEVQDANNAKRFAASLAEGCVPVKDTEDKITFEVGTNNWPLPIPLVRADGQWHFDTAAGKEEIISRHIGKDELHAISICRAYVTAQRQYADVNPKVGGGAKYAQKFKSTPGTKDGLYWPVEGNEPASPFGPLVAEAHAEGYGTNKDAGPHPFHGYCFRILTQQGEAAPGGKMDYLSDG